MRVDFFQTVAFFAVAMGLIRGGGSACWTCYGGDAVNSYPPALLCSGGCCPPPLEGAPFSSNTSVCLDVGILLELKETHTITGSQGETPRSLLIVKTEVSRHYRSCA
jgi:hypothetical protein